jgi:hypothetical protein
MRTKFCAATGRSSSSRQTDFKFFKYPRGWCYIKGQYKVNGTYLYTLPGNPPGRKLLMSASTNDFMSGCTISQK